MVNPCPKTEVRGPGPNSDEQPREGPGFDAVYQAHFEVVWRVLRRLGVPPSSLDDALQDVFLVVYRRLGAFEGRSALRTWIIGITLRVGMQYVRQNRRSPLPLLAEADLPDPGTQSPWDPTVRSEAVALLYRLLGELDAEKRAAFVLSEIEGMALREIAEAVGANINTVASRVRSARAQFQAALDRHRARDTWRKSSP